MVTYTHLFGLFGAAPAAVKEDIQPIDHEQQNQGVFDGKEDVHVAVDLVPEQQQQAQGQERTILGKGERKQ